MIKQEIIRGYSFFKKKGLKSTITKAKRHIKEQAAYKMWPALSEERREKQRNRKFAYRPLISIIVPLYNTPVDFLEELVDSVIAQTYSNWELCLADGTAKETEITLRVRKYMENEDRIKYKILDENEGISGNTNKAMEMAAGDYIALADHDDILSPSALYEIVRAINKNSHTDVLYTDEDKVDTDGKGYYMPHFKPDYNEEYFLANNYICHFFVVKRDIALSTGGFDSEYDGAQDYDFIWKCIERAEHVHHVPKVLYHWRCHMNSTAGRPESKLYAYENGAKVLRAHYKRCGIDADVEMYPESYGYYKTTYRLTSKPEVTVLTIGGSGDAGSRIKYQCSRIHVDDYNIDKINDAILKQNNRYVLLADGNAKIDANHIKTLLSYVLRDNTAVAGGRIYDNHGKLLFGGFTLGVRGSFGYAFQGAGKSDRGYYLRIAVPQQTMAVCGCFMMIDTEYFSKVGGFDNEMDFATAVADYCLKVRTTTDKISVYVPDATIKTKRSKEYYADVMSLQKFKAKWSNIIQKGDPFYNKNLTLNFADYSLRKKGVKY